MAKFKQYFDILAYALLSALLIGACFSTVFAWITAGYVLVLAVCFHNETKLVGLMLFTYCFYGLFHYVKIGNLTLEILLAGIWLILILGIYVYRVVKKQQKLNYKTLVPICLFFVYLTLPVHECSFIGFFEIVFFFVSTYIIFEERKLIDFRYVIRCLVVGVVISCSLTYFKNISPLLTDNIRIFSHCGVFRFSGLSQHPNVLGRIVMIAICAVLLLKCLNKISLIEFIMSFTSLFIFGYLTLSRAFVITVIAAVVLFIVIGLIRNHTRFLALGGLVVILVCIVGGIFFNITKIYFDRLSFDSDFLSIEQCQTFLTTEDLENTFDNQPKEWQDAVFAGEIRFDPGRAGLRELYLRDWASSQKIIWFGRGVSRPAIGKMAAHNLYIQELWEHGIVGYLFYLVIILSAINWKKIKQLKHFATALILIVPYCMTTVIEPCLNDFFFLIIIILSLGLVEHTNELSTKNNLYDNKSEIID